jgi:hypothetical protein
VEHDLIGGDRHLHRVGYRDYCMCWGSCCFSGSTLDCLCEECDCGIKGSPVTTTRLTPPAPSTPPAHACETCGTEVFRNGTTRGRFPKKCPTCKVQ